MSHKIRIPIEVLSFQEEGNHLFVSGKLGEQPLRLLIDTGASKTVFDKNFLAEKFPEIKLESTEQVTTGVGTNTLQSEIAEIIDFSLGDLTLSHFKIAVLDLSHVNETYSTVSVEPIHGVIGCDLLVEHEAVINLKKGSLKLRKR